jgi:mannose-6-phosphate isomerase-like protein (cupin superfamily)
MECIRLEEKFSRIDDHWNPRIIAALNGQYVKAAKLKGTFVWHRHEKEDELFWVHKGKLRLEFRDRVVELGPGELCVVPRGIEHRPVAEEEVEILLFEPRSTLNTGNVENEHTRKKLDTL